MNLTFLRVVSILYLFIFHIHILCSFINYFSAYFVFQATFTDILKELGKFFYVLNYICLKTFSLCSYIFGPPQQAIMEWTSLQGRLLLN